MCDNVYCGMPPRTSYAHTYMHTVCVKPGFQQTDKTETPSISTKWKLILYFGDFESPAIVFGNNDSSAAWRKDQKVPPVMSLCPCFINRVCLVETTSLCFHKLSRYLSTHLLIHDTLFLFLI